MGWIGAAGRIGRAGAATAAVGMAVVGLGAPPLPASAQDAALLAEACTVCHGPQGAGMGSVPALAGRDRAELATLLAAFRANERPATIMNRIARGYTEAEIAALAAHFAGER